MTSYRDRTVQVTEATTRGDGGLETRNWHTAPGPGHPPRPSLCRDVRRNSSRELARHMYATQRAHLICDGCLSMTRFRGVRRDGRTAVVTPLVVVQFDTGGRRDGMIGMRVLLPQEARGLRLPPASRACVHCLCIGGRKTAIRMQPTNPRVGRRRCPARFPRELAGSPPFATVYRSAEMRDYHRS